MIAKERENPGRVGASGDGLRSEQNFKNIEPRVGPRLSGRRITRIDRKYKMRGPFHPYPKPSPILSAKNVPPIFV